MSERFRGKRASDRAGTALIAALFVVTMVATLCMAFLQLSLTKARENKSSVDGKRALYIAEAGLSEGFEGLVAGKSGNVGSDTAPASFADGVFWVTSKNVGTGHIMLKSTGLCGSGRCSLSMVVEPANLSIGALGFFSDRSLSIGNGCLIDSYDSRQGPYTPPPLLQLGNPPSDAKSGSNGSISVQGSLLAPTKIYGDAVPGPQSSLTRTSNVTITGSTAPAYGATTLPPIDIPSVASAGDLQYSNASRPLTIASGTHGYGALRVQSNAQLVVQGPGTLVVDALEIDSGSKLTIDATNGPVRIYVQSSMQLQSGSTLSTAGTNPAWTSVLVAAATAGSVTLGSSGTFYGTIYSPSADVSIPSALEVFGSVTARNLSVQGRAKLHFDLALRSAAGEKLDLPHAICWRVVDLPQVPLVKSHLDPTLAMSVLGIASVPASNAHFDVGVNPPSHDPAVTPYTGGLVTALQAADAPSQPGQSQPASTTDVAQLGLINNGAILGDLLVTLLAPVSPLSENVLISAITRCPEPSSSSMKTLLLANSPLTYKELVAVANLGNKITSSDLRAVLAASSPLPIDIVAGIQDGSIKLSAADKTAVLSLQ